jgi:hypothetical protein
MTALNLKGKEKPLTCICVRRDPPLGLDVTLTGAPIMVAMVTPWLWHDGWNTERKIMIKTGNTGSHVIGM